MVLFRVTIPVCVAVVVTVSVFAIVVCVAGCAVTDVVVVFSLYVDVGEVVSVFTAVGIFEELELVSEFVVVGEEVVTFVENKVALLNEFGALVVVLPCPCVTAVAVFVVCKDVVSFVAAVITCDFDVPTGDTCDRVVILNEGGTVVNDMVVKSVACIVVVTWQLEGHPC